MMSPFGKTLTLTSFIALASCQETSDITVHVQNWLNEPVTDSALRITDQKTLNAFAATASGLPTVIALKNVKSNHTIYGQLDDFDQDGEADEAFFLLNVDALEKSEFRITETETPTIEPRTKFTISVKQGGTFNADGLYINGGDFVSVNHLNVPSEQEQDSKLAYMEGPLWENDRVGFRYYLDDRNRYDVFGKSQPAMALANIEGDYHAISAWGADVLKVGKSTGLGSIAIMADSGPKFIDNVESKQLSILSNGPFRSIMRTNYEGWKADGKSLNVISDLEIQGGALWTSQHLKVTGTDENTPFVTGIVKHAAAPQLVTGVENGIFYAYTWGKQSEQHELLGMAILMPEKYMPHVIEGDAHSHLITYELIAGEADYRFMAGWERNKKPFKTQESFEAAIKKAARQYEQPLS